MDYIHFGQKSLLGLDIQAEEIRLLQLQGLLKIRRIKHAISQKLPSGAVIEGKIQEPEIVSACLQELVQVRKLQKFRVAIALPEQCVVSQSISVAKGLKESELEEEVISHLRNTMSGITEGLCYDYIIEGSHDEIHHNVLVVAAPFTHLRSYMTVVQSTGLKVQLVDVDQYALIRAKHHIEKMNFDLDPKWLVSFGLALRGHLRW